MRARSPMPGFRRLAQSPNRFWTSGQPRIRDARADRPSLATGSCPREASRLAQRNFDFLYPPGGVGQGLSDVFGLQVRILAKNLLARSPCRYKADQRADCDAHAADAWLSAHYGGVT